MNNQDFKEQVVNSVSWTGLSQVVTQSLQFIVTVILARLLIPKDFGIVGLSILFIGLVAILGEVGFGAALIQKKDADHKDLSTVFWLGIGVGFLSFAIASGFSPLAARFFHNANVRVVIIAASLGFIINSIGAVQKVLLTKGLLFKKLAAAEIGAVFIYGTVSITLALLGAKVWSLVIGSLCRSFVEVCMLWYLSSWRPSFRVSKESIRQLFGFSANVWGFNILNYVRENIDNIVIGRVLGATALGYYTLAYNLANLPRRQLTNIIGRVSFPAFAKIQDQDEYFRRIYLKVVRYISLVSFPILAGLGVLAPEFIKLVYGQKWALTILPLQILCGAGMLYSLGTTVGSIYLAKGRPDIQFKVGIFALLVLTAMVFKGVSYGVTGVAASVLIYTIVSLLAGQAFANALIKLRMLDYIRAILPATLNTGCMLIVLIAFRYAGNNLMTVSDFIWFIAAVLLGAVVYLALTVFSRIEETTEAIGVLRKLLQNMISIARRRPLLAAGTQADCVEID